MKRHRIGKFPPESGPHFEQKICARINVPIRENSGSSTCSPRAAQNFFIAVKGTHTSNPLSKHGVLSMDLSLCFPPSGASADHDFGPSCAKKNAQLGLQRNDQIRPEEQAQTSLVGHWFCLDDCSPRLHVALENAFFYRT